MNGTVFYARLETSECTENEALLCLYLSKKDMDPAHGCSFHAIRISQVDLTQLIKRGIKIAITE